MPCCELTKAGRRDGESERRACQHHSGLRLLGDAAAERGVGCRLDSRHPGKNQADLISANKLIWRSVARRRQARPCGRARGFELERMIAGNEKRLQPEVGPAVGDALRAADDVEPREQSRDDRAGDGAVVAYRSRNANTPKRFEGETTAKLWSC